MSSKKSPINPDPSNIVEFKNSPKFHSEQIQETFDRIKPLIDKNMQAADKIRDDFKTFQAYLQKQGAFVNYVYQGGEYAPVMSEDNHELQRTQFLHSIEGLAWFGFQGSQHRLLYVVQTVLASTRNIQTPKLKSDLSKAEILPPLEDFQLPFENKLWAKPILECSSEVRQRMYVHLSDFLTGFGQQLAELFRELPLPQEAEAFLTDVKDSSSNEDEDIPF